MLYFPFLIKKKNNNKNYNFSKINIKQILILKTFQRKKKKLF